MIEALLPPTVAAVEAFEDPPSLGLYPEEAICVRAAVPSRQSEFATGRHCARSCLSRLGVQAGAITKDTWGAPRWPKDIVGSITHCAGYRAAALAWTTDVTSIGIDAEPHTPLPPDVLRLVSSPRERTHLAELSLAAPDVAWDRILFSAKESVYKAWFPITHTFLDFTDAEITFDPATSRFVAELGVPGPRFATTFHELAGAFTVRDGLLTTAVIMIPEPLPLDRRG